jgi:hypothetical protein
MDVLRTFDSALGYVGLSREFRARMTEGQKMSRHNQFREDFYNAVVTQAKQLEAQRVGRRHTTFHILLR